MRPVITSLRNPTIKHAIKLRDGTHRRKAGQFLIDGQLEIRRAADSGIQIETVFIEEQHAPPESVALELLQPVSRDVLGKLSYGERESTPVAIGRTPELCLSDLPLSPNGLYLILDRTEKPGNLGACLRTAAAVGVDGVILNNPVCEPFNPNAIRASRGAMFSLPLAASATAELLDFCRDRAIHLYAARIDGSTALWDAKFDRRVGVVFGNEARGLPREWQEPNAEGLQIPMQPCVDSLNLSISSAITLYEAFRQRSRPD